MKDELKHYGIHGQKWGVRRWQNEDGSFNDAGKIRYGRIGKGIRQSNLKRLNNAYKASMRDFEDLRKNGYKEEAKAVKAVADKLKSYLDNYANSGSILTERQKQIFGVGAVATAAILAGVGVYKLSQVKSGALTDDPFKDYKILSNKTGKVLTGKEADEVLSSFEEAQKITKQMYEEAGIPDDMQPALTRLVNNFSAIDEPFGSDAWLDKMAKASTEYNTAIWNLDHKKDQVEKDIVNRHKDAAAAIGDMLNDIDYNLGKLKSRNEARSERINEIQDKLNALNDSIDKAREVGVPESQIIKDKGDLDDYFLK